VESSSGFPQATREEACEGALGQLRLSETGGTGVWLTATMYQALSRSEAGMASLMDLKSSLMSDMADPEFERWLVWIIRGFFGGW
jgi:hypothetical protein